MNELGLTNLPRGEQFNSQVGKFLSYCVLMHAYVSRKRKFGFEAVSQGGIERQKGGKSSS